MADGPPRGREVLLRPLLGTGYVVLLTAALLAAGYLLSVLAALLA